MKLSIGLRNCVCVRTAGTPGRPTGWNDQFMFMRLEGTGGEDWLWVLGGAGQAAPCSIHARKVSTSAEVSLGPDSGMKRLGSTLETIWISVLSTLYPGLIAGPE